MLYFQEKLAVGNPSYEINVNVIACDHERVRCLQLGFYLLPTLASVFMGGNISLAVRTADHKK